MVTQINLRPDLSLSEVSKSGVGRDQVLGFYRDFRSELGDLMTNLMNDDEDLKLGGFTVPAENKTGAAGTFLMNNWMDDQNFVFGKLLDAFKFEQDLENKINNLFSS